MSLSAENRRIEPPLVPIAPRHWCSSFQVVANMTMLQFTTIHFQTIIKYIQYLIKFHIFVCATRRNRYSWSNVEWFESSIQEEAHMKHLWAQIMKFGIVGSVAFVIDFGIFNLLVQWRISAPLASVVSFLISLVFNYAASMRWVFERREDMARWMQMLIFVLSALVGLLINLALTWLVVDCMLPTTLATNHTKYQLFADMAKLAATAVVTVWNFLIRKWLLEPPSPRLPAGARAISEKLGQWSIKIKSGRFTAD